MKSVVVMAPDARARGIEFIPDAMVVHLEDGRSLLAPSRDGSVANKLELVGGTSSVVLEISPGGHSSTRTITP
jgi:hypothetical protein